MEVPRSLRKRMHSETKGLAALVQREVDRLDWLAVSAKRTPGAFSKVCLKQLVLNTSSLSGFKVNMRKGSLGTLRAQGSLQVDSESKGIQKAQGVPILAEVNLYCIILGASHRLHITLECSFLMPHVLRIAAMTAAKHSECNPHAKF